MHISGGGAGEREKGKESAREKPLVAGTHEP